ncbi:kinesin-like protein kin12a [Phtheirospermum japonicum]|uniref:Kinesin-like protein kin12a n=1 Tax=Phtheirospermum japonicum TaxID=374723 RepID=A0A830BJY3_9LAMI|nr:kinesin-like protein kin12a [Phtheirospermum japonicum]
MKNLKEAHTLLDNRSLFSRAKQRNVISTAFTEATASLSSTVVVRIRPAKGLGIRDSLVSKVSKNSLSVAARSYTFDSVFDSDSTQTRSGKSYTMWGPPSAMVEGPSVNGPQGIVPRIFQNLFSEIQKIKDDAKNGFYVENLTEEYVTCYEDVTQVLIKESSLKCFGSSKISRISLVDRAGFERNVLDDASRQHVKEGKCIKKPTSQLGHQLLHLFALDVNAMIIRFVVKCFIADSLTVESLLELLDENSLREDTALPSPVLIPILSSQLESAGSAHVQDQSLFVLVSYVSYGKRQ